MSNQQPLSVEHFRNILTCETKNLNQLCERWAKILESRSAIESQDVEEEIKREHEETLGTIRATIGKAKLLMSQRFKQFSDLIDDCEFNTGQHPTRLDDLLGFWEMISYQVEDVVRNFKSLDRPDQEPLG